LVYQLWLVCYAASSCPLLEESNAICNLVLQWLKSQGNTSGLANNTQDDARDVYTDTWFFKKVGKLLHGLHVAFHRILWVYTLSTHSDASSLSPGSALDCRWIYTPILPFHIHFLSEEHNNEQNKTQSLIPFPK
jgi:hypothetical protein